MVPSFIPLPLITTLYLSGIKMEHTSNHIKIIHYKMGILKMGGKFKVVSLKGVSLKEGELNLMRNV